jgi:ABC-2 type transport system ATP-binding protein
MGNHGTKGVANPADHPDRRPQQDLPRIAAEIRSGGRHLQPFSNDYEEIKAVDSISFDIEPGELVGYIGPNGAGKSTTIKMLAGILHPTGGELVVYGLAPQKERVSNCRKIGVIFGPRSLLNWDLPVTDSLALMRRMYAIPKERYQASLKRFVELLSLKEFMGRAVRRLSLGQRMRCELVASLLHDLKIVYLDEPTSCVDVVAKEHIHEFIQRPNEEHGTIVILTTHDINDIERLCRRVMIIDKGRLIYDGSLGEIRRRCGRRRVVFSVADGAKMDGPAGSLDALGGGLSTQMQNDGRIVVGFDPQQVPASPVTRHIVNNHPVSDLAVEEADLEAIIREMYNRGTDDVCRDESAFRRDQPAAGHHCGGVESGGSLPVRLLHRHSGILADDGDAVIPVDRDLPQFHVHGDTIRDLGHLCMPGAGFQFSPTRPTEDLRAHRRRHPSRQYSHRSGPTGRFSAPYLL